MEKIIRDLDVTWNTMKFDTEPHLRTKQSLLQPSDELVETLEDNQVNFVISFFLYNFRFLSFFLLLQVQLQNMLSSKYIAFFSVEVSAWQKKLSQADQVLTIMLEVQRTWSHLESIFVGSEDIRNQLPEDSKRFDKV
jgi:dynein heavy chain